MPPIILHLFHMNWASSPPRHLQIVAIADHSPASLFRRGPPILSLQRRLYHPLPAFPPVNLIFVHHRVFPLFRFNLLLIGVFRLELSLVLHICVVDGGVVVLVVEVSCSTAWELALVVVLLLLLVLVFVIIGVLWRLLRLDVLKGLVLLALLLLLSNWIELFLLLVVMLFGDVLVVGET